MCDIMWPLKPSQYAREMESQEGVQKKNRSIKIKQRRRYFKCSRDIILTWESDVFVWIKTITMWYFLLVDIYPYLWGAVYEVRDSCHTSISVLLAWGIVTFVFRIHNALAMPYL